MFSISSCPKTASSSTTLVNKERLLIDQVVALDSPERGRSSILTHRRRGRNSAVTPSLPFFFTDKDSICHRAICSLRVRISMISNHSASLPSPWRHLYERREELTAQIFTLSAPRAAAGIALIPLSAVYAARRGKRILLEPF